MGSFFLDCGSLQYFRNPEDFFSNSFIYSFKYNPSKFQILFCCSAFEKSSIILWKTEFYRRNQNPTAQNISAET